MNYSEKNWYLFQNCIPVKGANRSIIYDLQRSTFTYIPNVLYEIVKNKKIPSIDSLIVEYGQENKQVIIDYIQLLHENEYIFQTDNFELFPPLSMDFNKAGKIDNAIIDYDSTSDFTFETIFDQLEGLGCNHVEIRFFDIFEISFLQNVVDLLMDRTFKSVFILYKHDGIQTKQNYFDVLASNNLITSLTIHSSKEINDDENFHNRLLYIEDELVNNTCCGQISFNSFSINPDMFIESKKFNNCLNKKISVDAIGKIKNCPSSLIDFGHINQKTLNEALLDKNFKEKWGISKDEIEICKDCEFRYMCSDCRVYVADEQNIKSKPSKCNYNPYTSTWGK